MLFLAANPLIAPTIGMVFWALVIFLITWLILGRFTFKPIANALKERETSIGNALAEADRARAEMARIQAANEAALKAQMEERTAMVREAKEAREQIIREAKAEAEVLRARLFKDAQADIESLKQAAITDVKNSAGQIAIDVAQRVMRNQLEDPAKQVAYANTLIDEINFN